MMLWSADRDVFEWYVLYVGPRIGMSLSGTAVVLVRGSGFLSGTVCWSADRNFFEWYCCCMLVRGSEFF